MNKNSAALLACVAACSGPIEVDRAIQGLAAGAQATDEAPVFTSPVWPSPMALRSDQPPVPARDSSGNTWFVVCGDGEGQAVCQSLAADGSAVRSVALGAYGAFPPAAGDVDGLPGDEVVIWDVDTVRIMSPDLAPIRAISTNALGYLYSNRHVLADLDGDGIHEIVTLVSLLGYGGSLEVHRGNGQPFSDQYPRPLGSDSFPEGVWDLEGSTADFDGDGSKDIAVMMRNAGGDRSAISVFHGDGRVMSSWPQTVLAGTGVGLRSADLERDGRAELVVQEYFIQTQQHRLRVLQHGGADRPGWPLEGAGSLQAIADLNGDGHKEILARTELPSESPRTLLLGSDGTRFGPGTLPLESHWMGVVADVDGDTIPEIVIPELALDNTVRLKAFSGTGTLIRSWVLSQPAAGAFLTPPYPVVGEFTRDGQTDIAMHSQAGGTPPAHFGIMTTGTPYQPCAAAWPTLLADPQSSGAAPALSPCRPTPPSLEPEADAYVGDGSGAGKNHGSENLLAVGRSDRGDNRITYLRFSLKGMKPGLASASIRLYDRRPTPSRNTVSAFAVASDSWSESRVTWKTRPTIGARLSRGVVSTVPGYVEWDVSKLIAAKLAKGAAQVSFAIQMDRCADNQADLFNSREAKDNRPQLVITPVP